MASRSDNKQVRLEIGCKPHDVPHRMTRDDVGMKLYLAFFGHCARTLEDAMDSAGGRFLRPAIFFDDLRQIGDFLDANQVQFGFVLFSDGKCQRQCVEGMLGAVTGVQDFVKHRTSP
jgi:hypothetical protein